MPMVAIYPGSFDPITNGHVDLIERGLKIFEKVIVAVAQNSQKGSYFPLDERIRLVKEVFRRHPQVEVDRLEGLLVDYAARRGARVIMKGLRAITDFEYEFEMAMMNRRLNPGIETMFLMTGEDVFFIASRLVREVASFGGSIDGLVPEAVKQALLEKIARESSK